MNKKSDDLRLYAIVRNDLASMNAGKAVAQGMHAQRLADIELTQGETWGKENSKRYKAWCALSGFGFGSTITLGAPPAEMTKIRQMMQLASIPSGWVHDPTYPLSDGEFCHLIPLDTVLWAFGYKQDLEPLLSKLPLY